ncbi:MAG: TIGR01777 family oxidoreductase [Solirubrobacteraceae bacterium]
MKVAVTGATGLIGSRIVEQLTTRGDEVTVLSRDPERAREALGVDARAWDPEEEAAPAAALAGRDGVVHLLGENVAQRWSDDARARIASSREVGTRNLVAGLRAAQPQPAVLVSASASGYYGPHGDERVTEEQPPADDFLGAVCARWEAEAQEAEALGMRVALMRNGIVLDGRGGALKRMLLPFRLGVGGPIAGGRQYMPWIAAADVAGMYLAALDGSRWSGPVNVTAPEPVTNRDFSKALGRALGRPAIAPVPAVTLKLLYGEMAQVVLTGVRAVPARAQELGYAFRHADLDEALRVALED